MKFKEPRLLTICFIAFLGMIMLAVKAASEKDTAKMMITIVLSLMALTMILGRFNMVVKEDFMMVYVFRYIGILPVMIEYPDLVAVKQISKMKMKIQTKRQTFNVYVLNTNKFSDYLKLQTEKMELTIKYEV